MRFYEVAERAAASAGFLLFRSPRIVTNEIVIEIPLHDRFALGIGDFSRREFLLQFTADSIVCRDSPLLVRERLDDLSCHLKDESPFNLMEQKFRTFEIEFHVDTLYPAP
jgi:hypothetical protein